MQGDRKDKCAKGWDEPEKVQPHESQIGRYFYFFSSFISSVANLYSAG